MHYLAVSEAQTDEARDPYDRKTTHHPLLSLVLASVDYASTFLMFLTTRLLQIAKKQKDNKHTDVFSAKRAYK